MMDAFSIKWALVGGVMIGLASVGMLYLNGRVTGISGILGQALTEKKERGWRMSFLAGLLSAGIIYYFHMKPDLNITVTQNIYKLIAAGLFVGIGTRLGGGCTSGHGICGIARLSKRSIAATVLFMLSGALTIYIFQHILNIR